MPKKKSARKTKPQKQVPAVDIDANFFAEFRAVAIGSFTLSRSAFMDALNSTGLIESVTEAYKNRQIFQTEWMVRRLDLSREKRDAMISHAAKEFQERLPEALYAAALIIAYQVSRAIVGNEPVSKVVIRELAEWLFVTKGERTLLADGRGRKQKIESGRIVEAILERGPDASRKGVAFDVGISERTLNGWRSANHYSSWKEAVEDITRRTATIKEAAQSGKKLTA